jgi:hypothetical protein
MIFEFLHKENYCYAFVNEKSFQPGYTVTVYILDCNWELGYEIIFFRLEDQWQTTASVAVNHPETYNGICDRLEAIFPGCFLRISRDPLLFKEGKVA